MEFLVNRWFTFNFPSVRLRLWDEWMIKSAIQSLCMLFAFTHTYCCWIVLTVVALMTVNIILPPDLIRVWLNLSSSINRHVLLLTSHYSKSFPLLSLDLLNCSLFQLLLVLLLWSSVQEFSQLTLCKLILLIEIGLLAFYKIVHLISLHWMELIFFKKLTLKRVLL